MTRLVRPLAVLILGFGLAACDRYTSSPSEVPAPTPTGTPAPAETSVFDAILLPENEVPAIAGEEKDGSAGASFRITVTRDAAGAITAATLDAAVRAAGFPPGTPLVAAHIHTGAVGVNGNSFVTLGLALGEVILANGGGSFNKTGIVLTPGQASAILAEPSGFYFDLHSAANLGGVARGQLIRSY
jgi:hypothetical protein